LRATKSHKSATTSATSSIAPLDSAIDTRLLCSTSVFVESVTAKLEDARAKPGPSLSGRISTVLESSPTSAVLPSCNSDSASPRAALRATKSHMSATASATSAILPSCNSDSASPKAALRATKSHRSATVAATSAVAPSDAAIDTRLLAP